MENTSKKKSASRSSVTANAGKYPKFAQRLSDLMGAKSENDEALGKAVGVSQQAINQYRKKIAFPKMETLLTLADHFECSLNYLVGLSDVPSTDPRVEYICEYTGLSQDAVELLHLISQSTIKESKRTTRFLNMVLSDRRLVRNDDDFPIETLFSLMDQYLDAATVKLSSRYGEREENRNIVSLESSEDMIEAESVPKLYKQLKLMQIVNKLDGFEKERAGESK